MCSTPLSRTLGSLRLTKIFDVSNGIAYLHNRTPPICHGDLKSLNILVNSNYHAIITDFGSARTICDTNSAKVKNTSPLDSGPESPRVELAGSGTSITVTGPAWTLRWAAPELLNAETPDLASDVWAFAWICWEVMTGNFPFYGENESTVIVRLATGNLPTVGDNQQLSQLQALCSLMTDCWSLDPDRRPTSSSCAEYIRRWMVRLAQQVFVMIKFLTFFHIGLGGPVAENARGASRRSVR
ncbi:hypothetical protein M407DRAFT_71987 [Tulasnella calospora MUT 4182]|uniref:Protein kinase domain-containing protein n=1 Tax=Tulasnella calospora MUT 4182 TaxID=1051891 RepID=A0A0C3M3S4_9AGAM|nr:hypothetical protein M407DRAFT_71987 [Tulasnella calospora MUT 4182]